jgi:hypothetical protein
MATRIGSSVLGTHWFSRTAAIFALAVLASACGGSDADRPARVQVENPEDSSTSGVETETNKGKKKSRPECEAGDAEECRIELPSQGSVKNCVDGVRYCDNGKWSECEVH